MSGLSGQGTGVTPSGPGCQPTASAAEEASSRCGIPNAVNPFGVHEEPQRCADWASGLSEGMRWYADYIQRISEIRSRAYWEHPYGDAGDALDFACDHCGPEEALAFLGDWRADRAEEWPGYMRWLKVQQDGAKASAIEARKGGDPPCPGCGGIGMFHNHPCPDLKAGLHAKHETATRKDDAHD